jgi:hypothetical protein
VSSRVTAQSTKEKEEIGREKGEQEGTHMHWSRSTKYKRTQRVILKDLAKPMAQQTAGGTEKGKCSCHTAQWVP